jgi:DNA-binding FadR family transcriptional regulator
MEEYDVSRPTLREALRLLEAQDLISVRRGSHRGPVVSLPDASVTARAVAIQLQLRGATLADVYQFRMIYEPTAARMAAENATPEGVEALRGIVAEEARCRGDYRAFAEVSWRFHSVLIGLSKNATMSVVTESLQHISEQHAAKGMSVALDRDEQQARSVKAHRKLVDLIEKGAGAEAERFWARHMAAVADVQKSWLEDQSVTELLD